ncbi:transposase [Pedobacter ginsenosidimutans]|uniref:Transposase n=1 Tax=Pedobacter ginsenosidimutans TaxID=687842 RepID=A0A0T5VK37_9SPHI|nr:transposase [Pedobacter ginsenosidimutans]KRT14243.1 transposase [Pedobacter ginsenosidimutans]
MSTKYKFHEPTAIYFISFAVVGWIDVFTRTVYRDLLLESLSYCRKEKGLNLHAWIIMSNHVHLIISSKEGYLLPNIMRDLKKYSSYRILKEIRENTMESRKEWMLYLFSKAGQQNSNNKNFQFWRQDNHPIELDPHLNMFEERIDYLHNNPVEAGLVANAADYLYSSAIDYEGGKGLIDIDVLI